MENLTIVAFVALIMSVFFIASTSIGMECCNTCNVNTRNESNISFMWVILGINITVLIISLMYLGYASGLYGFLVGKVGR